MIVKNVSKNIRLLIPNPYHFELNKEHLVREYIENKCLNKCYGGFYILNIIDIPYISNLIVNKNSLRGDAHVNITFIFNGIIITPDELIPMCKITLIIPGQIIKCKTKFANIGVEYKPEFDSLVAGQYIPVTVDTVKHITNNNISIMGSFVGIKSSYIYYSSEHTGPFDPGEDTLDGSFITGDRASETWSCVR